MFLSIFSWLAGSRIGRFLAAAGAVLLALLAVHMSGKKAGRQEIRNQAVEAAEDRRKDRVEIQRDVTAIDDPVSELRDRWSRD